jgi:hypothetical protein
VGGELGVDVGLAGALGAQLDQIVIALAVGNQAHKLEQLVALAEQFRVEAHALNQQVDPFVSAELPPSRQVALHVEVGELDRLDPVQQPGTGVLVLAVSVFKVGDAPDAADQELRMAFDRVGIDQHLLDAQVGECRLVHIAPVVERHAHFVDHLVAAPLADSGAHQASLAAMHVVLAQDFPHRLHAGLNAGFIGGSAVLAQQILQHVGRHDGVATHQLDQVLAYDQAGEVLIDFLIEEVHRLVLRVMLRAAEASRHGRVETLRQASG